MRAPTLLHQLLDEVPKQQWPFAQRYLEFLKSYSPAEPEVQELKQELPEEQVVLLNQALNEVDRGELVDGEAFFEALRRHDPSRKAHDSRDAMPSPGKPMIPPHANAAVHARIMAWLEKATPEEIFESGIRAGIYSHDGKLLPPYADEEAPSPPPSDEPTP